jgi:hypothetical protein
MKPYDVHPDGAIRIHPDQQADLERLFGRAGIDIRSIQTEEDFRKAHAAAGEVLLGILFGAAEEGDQTSLKVVQQLAEGDLSNCKATLARSLFKAV